MCMSCQCLCYYFILNERETSNKNIVYAHGLKECLGSVCVLVCVWRYYCKARNVADENERERQRKGSSARSRIHIQCGPSEFCVVVVLFLLSYFLSFACVLFWTRRKKKNHIYRKISFVFLIELNGSAHQYTHSTHVCIHQFRMKRVAHIPPTCVSHISTHFERVTTFDCTERWAVCFFLLSFFFFPSSLSFAFFFFFAFYSYCMYRCCRRRRCRRCCCCYEIMK